jgi:uncharacterized protein YuzE
MTEFKVTYDQRADVLYVTTGSNGPSLATEGDDGIVWRHLSADGRLVGMTIMDFESYWKQHLTQLTDQLANKFHVPKDQAQTALLSQAS